ncbi:hypothetical protein EZV62_026342 [Acer yangbiense]|uniref:NB-ARC domain-containing protein n=1 Tax=Acer yangbiense TaxID=1000413 RepID=A0A5C7GQW2_9ROSI|nr:hypothetical protein EZV62_026342 [Acer yangbiense]
MVEGVTYLVKNLGKFLLEEAKFLGGVKEEVKRLTEDLGSMQQSLKDAEEKQYGDPVIHKWVSDIKELSYDIEDMLDVFRLKVHDDSGCFRSVCSCIFDKCKEMVDLHNLSKQIKDFRDRINDLSSKSQEFRLKDSGNSAGEGSSKTTSKLRELRRSVSFAVEENVVGLVDDAQTLLAKLLDDDPRHFIVSIYGMGGLGKTTVAGKLYHHNSVKSKFKNRAWVAVSQDYTTQDLLIRIFKSFDFRVENNEDLKKMDKEDLRRRLHESLQGDSYLLVLDDVWDKEVWRILKAAFPDNKNGRVIMTTRNEEVAKSSDERTHSHRLRKLKEEESWQLFCEKTSQNFNADEELKKLGKEMVQKCNGLPLAIIVLGGMLSNKKPQEWHGVHNHLWRHLKAGSIEINFLLALSFDSLPHQLKPCFLYLGLFPEDSEIIIDQLIYLWVAEGFISENEDCIMEEVAKDYINELINRSLIQVGKRYWGRTITFRVHDLLHDLAIDKAKKFNFLYIYDEIRDSNISSVIPPCPRQAIYYLTERFLSLQNNPHLRSLFLFSIEGIEDEDKGVDFALATLCRKFRCLRVLDIDIPTDVELLKIFDKEIAKLIHLKYLGWHESRIDGSLIYNLQRLQTLVLYNSVIDVKPPTEISRLQELRHLIGRFGPFECGWRLWIENLTKLQTLRFVSLPTWAQIKTEKLVNLRELWLVGEVGCLDEKVFCFDSIANLKSLRILVVRLFSDIMYFSSLQPLSGCPHLMDLRLIGKLEKLPEDIHQVLPNLECLSLKESYLEDDPMPLLEKLPKLTVLNLVEGFYEGKKMMSSANGFQWLEILLLEVADETVEWQVEDGAFPRLKGLHIWQYSSNSSLNYPERLRSLPSPDLHEFQLGPYFPLD